MCNDTNMLKTMLCGASDMDTILPMFIEVTTEFGGEPWQYQSGEIQYLNTATANWEMNSRRTVAAADLCVFIVLERYGDLTWNAELREALDAGKPFLILCLQKTYDEYLALNRHTDINAVTDSNKRRLVETLTELTTERQFTLATFNFNTFKDIYRREASKLFGVALALLSQRSKREALVALFGDPKRLTRRDLDAVEELAIDETEDKYSRKGAISTLVARQAASPDTLRALIASDEQGIQRHAVTCLPSLYTQRPPDPEFMDDCVTLANNSDDLGVRRRLIPALFEIDVSEAVRALGELDLSEIGTRRRLAGALEEYESTICSEGLTTSVISLLNKCLANSEDPSWLGRCRSYAERLQETPRPRRKPPV
jgi:hypothetical protein